MAKKYKKHLKMYPAATVKAAYLLGKDVGEKNSEGQINQHFEELERRLNTRIHLVQKANRYLLNELLTLDKNEPLVGILVPCKLAQECVSILKKLRGSNNYHGRRLQALINKTDRRWRKIFKEADVKNQLESTNLPGHSDC